MSLLLGVGDSEWSDSFTNEYLTVGLMPEHRIHSDDMAHP
jgi:hypothetical protein